MATTIELNQKFYNTIESLLNTQGLSGQNGEELRSVYEESRAKIDALTGSYNEAVAPLQKYLKRTTQAPNDEADIDKIKRQIAKLRKGFEGSLEEIRREQYHQFDLALECLPAERLSAATRSSVLIQLDKAQQLHREDIGDHMNKVEEHVSNLSNFEAKRDQRFSTTMLLRAAMNKDNLDRKSRPIGRYYRPFGLGTETGAPERDYISEFSPDDIELHGTTWRATDEKQKEEKRKVGATEMGTDPRKKKVREEDWFFADADYLKDQKRLVFDDLPAASAFKGIGVVALYQRLGLKATNEFIINLDEDVKENKKKGIPAAKGAVTCELPINASASEVDTIMSMLAHTYIAKGWHLGKGVDLELTPAQYRDRAYIACIRAGFRPDQLYVNGKLMSVSEEVQIEAKEERQKLEDAYKVKEAATSSEEGYTNLDEAVAQLAKVVHCADLSPATFFALDEQQQKTLFAQGSTQQCAEIMADYAFSNSPENIKAYMDIIRGRTNPRLLVPQQAELLDHVAGINPDRLFDIFRIIDDHQKVFNALNPETKATLLMWLPKADASRFFNAIEDDPDSELPNPKFSLLAQPKLSEQRVYDLYMGLPEGERGKAVDYLAQYAGNEDNRRALAAIVAQHFVASLRTTREAQVFPLLKQILRQVPEDSRVAFMQAVLDALSTFRPNGQPSRQAAFIDMVNNSQRPGSSSFKDLMRQALASNPQPPEALPTYSDQRVESIFSENNTEQKVALIFENENVQQTVNLLANHLNEAGAVIALLIDEANDDAKRNRARAVLTQLGPNKVGTVLAQIEQQDDRTIENFVNLFGQEHSFLANTLSVMFVINPDDFDRIWQQCRTQLAQNDQEPEVEGENRLLVSLLPHINHQGLIKAMLQGIQPAEVEQILISMPNKAQQQKIFDAVKDTMGPDIMRGQVLTLEQKARLFVSLNAEKQQNCIVAWLNANNFSEANQIIACWDFCKQLKEPAPLEAILAENAHAGYKNVIANGTKTSAAFLQHYLSSVATNQESVGDKFQCLMEGQRREFSNGSQKTAYYMTVGQALAKLEVGEDVRKNLFVSMGQNQPQQDQPLANDPAAQQVRASAIIHLVAQNKLPAARALVESLDQTSKSSVKDLVVSQAEPLPDELKRACYTAVGHRPAAQQQQQPQQQAPRNANT